MADLGIGRPVCLRVGATVVETVDTIRLNHLLAFARSTGKAWPQLEGIAADLNGSSEVDPAALIEELQRLTQERPPERLAPVAGLLRNDASRVAQQAASHHPEG